MVVITSGLAVHRHARAQFTLFTFQGRLLVTGNPANGNHDLRFIVTPRKVGGSQLGSIPTNLNVHVPGDKPVRGNAW